MPKTLSEICEQSERVKERLDAIDEASKPPITVENRRIWVVTAGEYEQCCPCAVFSSEEKAAEWVRLQAIKHPHDYVAINDSYVLDEEPF